MRRFFRNRDGAAAVEFGLIAPIVAAVLVGVTTTGGLIIAYNKMSQAVSAGAQYAMTANADDTAAIEDVVEMSWDGMPVGADVTVTQLCLCGSTESDCNAICEIDDDYPEKTTSIIATRSYSAFGAGTRTLTARQDVRTW